MARESGYSLLELIVAVAVAAVLALGAAPSMGLLEGEHTRRAARQLAQSMALARSEAMRTGRRVVVANGAERWEDGWVVFVDADNDGRRSLEENPLRQVAALNGVTLRGNATVRSYVSYLPAGRAALLSGAFQSGSFFVCGQRRRADGRGDYRLVLSIGGRVRLEELAAGAPECQTPLS